MEISGQAFQKFNTKITQNNDHMGILIKHKNQINLCIIFHILRFTDERGREKGEGEEGAWEGAELSIISKIFVIKEHT